MMSLTTFASFDVATVWTFQKEQCRYTGKRFRSVFFGTCDMTIPLALWVNPIAQTGQQNNLTWNKNFSKFPSAERPLRESVEFFGWYCEKGEFVASQDPLVGNFVDKTLDGFQWFFIPSSGFREDLRLVTTVCCPTHKPRTRYFNKNFVK